ncbi:hypothetical protein [Curtobacterium sp. MCLR17_054]|uniref:hypothetical protein n=1 Tax=Curtobacterium sp. MCLR17_054 TaxID=2175632 RepID=UPI000DAA1125|nr:hypothetical protein [Curtobacterium sp. MCLR17_054]WIE70309.1 hypothetical protein DEJ08_018205 [Curtobacterium sp. MCLR17_054]
MSERHRPTVRLLVAAVVAGSVAVLATECSFVQQQTGDAWSVTYEVRVDRPSGAALTDVRVEGAARRGDAPEVHRLGIRDTDTTDGDGSRWEHDAIVLAEQPASVRATPPEGATATYRILLDGKREIASATSAQPGDPVRCSANTPAFN